MWPSLGTAVRLLLAAALLWAGWRMAGPWGLVFASMGVAALLSRVLIESVAAAIRAVRAAAWRPFEGRYAAYHGVPIAVEEDADGHRWLRTADLRRVLQGYPRDALLLRRDGQRVGERAGWPGVWVRADALVEQLLPAHDERTQRFRTWVARDVLFPSPAGRRAAARTPAAPVPPDIRR